MNQLFRPEVLLSDVRPGRVSETSGSVGWPTVMACVLIAAVVFACLVALVWSPRLLRVEGVVEAAEGSVQIKAATSGRVERLLVEPGLTVQAGEHLITLSSTDRITGGVDRDAQASLRLTAIRSEVVRRKAAARSSGLVEESRSLEEKIESRLRVKDQLHSQLQEHARRRLVAASDVEEYKLLMEKGFGTRARLRAIENELSNWDREVRSVGVQLETLNNEIGESRSEQRRLALRAVAELEDNTEEAARIDQDRMDAMARLRSTISSPVHGRIAFVEVRPGDLVAKGDPILGIVANEHTSIVVTSVAANQLDCVSVGQEVRVNRKAQAGSSEQIFSGVVTRIEGPMVNTRGDGQPRYRVTIGDLGSREPRFNAPLIGATVEVAFPRQDSLTRDCA